MTVGGVTDKTDFVDAVIDKADAAAVAGATDKVAADSAVGAHFL